MSSPSSREVSGVDQPTLRPCGYLSSSSPCCVFTNVLSTLTSKPTLPCTTPWVSLQPDHNEGNRSQKRGWPHEQSGAISKWRWLSSVQARKLVGLKLSKWFLFQLSSQDNAISGPNSIPKNNKSECIWRLTWIQLDFISTVCLCTVHGNSRLWWFGSIWKENEDMQTQTFRNNQSILNLKSY